eukprot:jgi/Psemu1/246200/estExt_Genewise1.C_7410001
MGDAMNAIALDIVNTLNCDEFLRKAEEDIKDYGTGDAAYDDRFSFVEGGQEEDSIPEERTDDKLKDGFDDYDGLVSVSARHLFCLAATEKSPGAVRNEIQCDAGGKKRRTLLDLWSAARSQIPQDLLLKVLDLAREQIEDILGKSYNIWAPYKDDGVFYIVDTLNANENADLGGINGLEESLGPGKLFVDVGSCLGLTCLAINAKYPGTKIVSIEPASPSWLLQEINLRCNLPKKEFKNIKIILGGVGPNTEDEDDLMSKFMWRPASTTSTRSWTQADENKGDEVELLVRLRKLKSILAEADVLRPEHIDVLNLDCEGCEYNLIPSLSQDEFEKIPSILGQVHWGFINPNKLPSSERGRITHQRLCGHENIARYAKECCAFPDLPVKSSVPGEVLQRNDVKKFPPIESTVSDVIADKLCDDFLKWSKDHYLNDVPDDFNWFELSSQA